MSSSISSSSGPVVHCAPRCKCVLQSSNAERFSARRYHRAALLPAGAISLRSVLSCHGSSILCLLCPHKISADQLVHVEGVFAVKYVLRWNRGRSHVEGNVSILLCERFTDNCCEFRRVFLGCGVFWRVTACCWTCLKLEKQGPPSDRLNLTRTQQGNAGKLRRAPPPVRRPRACLAC